MSRCKMQAMFFVGRQREREQIHDILRAHRDSPVVAHIHGMPGIGKTELLQQSADDARALGYEVWAAPRGLPAAERAQLLREKITAVQRQTLLVCDDWQQLSLWEAALVERIENAHGPLVLFVASRLRPGSTLLDSRLLPGRLFSLELLGLDLGATIALMERRGISASDAGELHRITGGQPFAMLLLGDNPKGWPAQPANASTEALVRRLVGLIPDQESRDALELLALVGVVNEKELGGVFGWSALDARRVFDALRALTLVTRDTLGLRLHPIVRSALLGELHLRDPDRGRVLAKAVLPSIEEALSWSGQPYERALSQLRDLVAAAPQEVAISGMFQLDTTNISQARERDLAEAFALVEALEGKVAREIAERWVAHDPSSITIARGRDHIEGMMIRMDIRGANVPQALSEPAIERLIDVLTRDGRLTPGMLLRSTRFFLAREHHQTPCAALAALGAAITAQTLDTYEPFFSVQHISAHVIESWREIIATIGFTICEEATAIVDGRTIVPCVGDVTDQGVLFSGVARRAWGIEPRPVPASSGAQGEDIEEEVSLALRYLRDPIRLGSVALARRLFQSLSPEARGGRLQGWLLEAISSTESMRSGDLIAKALRASYDGNRSPDEAANHAKMSLSTLKRYRRLGVLQIAAIAAQRKP